MIRLKLNLPEATVNYDENGALVGIPAEHAPNQIRNYSLPFEITGYISKTDFLAYSLYSSARKFTVAEQISLLTSLGFKTVPYFENENGQGNQLITIKNQYSRYGAEWISLPSGKEFKIPELAHINSVKWKISPQKALTLECTTDKGVFEVFDMKLIAYYQPGCTAKVWNGELQPMNTAPIVEPIPPICPKCNNPLKRVQIYPDLPLFYKCTNSFCDQLVLDDPDTVVEPEVDDTELEDTAVETIVPESIPDTDEDVTGETETETEAAPKAPFLCYVDSKVDAEDVDRLVEEGKIQVADIDHAEGILVRTKLAVSKNARNLSKELGLELKPVSDFE